MSSKEFNLRREREIVGTMISLLRGGIYPWRSPYPAGSIKKAPYNFSTGDDYHGSNQVVLLADCWKSSNATPAYLGEKQAEKIGGALKAGMRPIWVVTARRIEASPDSADGSGARSAPAENAVPAIRYFWNRVYNYDQFDGLPELKSSHNAYAMDLDDGDNVWDAIAFAENYLRSQGIRIDESEHASSPAFNADRSVMTVPGKEMFANIAAQSGQLADYAALLMRESVYSTSLPLSRFAEQRKKGGKDDLEAMETMVCEIGTSILLNRFNLKAPEPAENVDRWIQQIQKSHKSLFRSFRDADRAAKHIDHAVSAMPQTHHLARTVEAGR